MRKTFLFLMLVGLFSSAFPQADKVTDYINRYKQIAMDEMIRTGVPASITLAQGILESGCGQSELAKSSNNHFGIKCKPEWTGARTFHDDDKKGECFRVYASPEESYRDHSDFLKNRPFYTDLFKLDPRDYRAWATGLKKDGYATEKDYATNLIRVIETYHLEDYSDLALAREQHPNANYASSNATTTPETAEAAKTATTLNNTASVNSSDIKIPVHADPPKMRVAQTMVSMPGYPTVPFLINNTKVIYAAKGVSLLALAAKYRINFHRLLVFNDLTDRDVISSGRLVFLQKKQKKGDKDFYVCNYGETLSEISNREAVQLKKLEEYNRIPANKKLAPQQKIYLASNAPKVPETLD